MNRAIKVFAGLVLYTIATCVLANTALAIPGDAVITHASMSTSAIPLWVTQRQNFFSKYRVKVQVVWVRGNPAQIATWPRAIPRSPTAARRPRSQQRSVARILK